MLGSSWAIGEMADALDLGSSVVRRKGSSPLSLTIYYQDVFTD